MSYRIKRLGVSGGWGRYWKRIVNDMAEPATENDLKTIRDLERFLSHGFVPVAPEYAVPEEAVVPPRMGWESYVYSNLLAYANARELEFERGLVEGRIAWELASQVFAAAYLSHMIRLEIHRLFPLRLAGRTLKSLPMQDLAYTALGVVLGCEPQATRLVRAQLAAYRKGYYGNAKFYPIYLFILSVLADYVENSAIEVIDEAVQEPILQQLLASWRTPDAGHLAPVCLAALDFHTHRCKHDNLKNFYEFTEGNWTRIPIEIWLIFKLRQRLGLTNPVLDHPMMAGACGVVPPDVGFRADPLITAVYERMKQDGFDEEAICAGLCATSS